MIVWLASYPRSGNTFLRTLLFHRFGVNSYSRYNDKSDIGKSDALSKAIGHENYAGSWDEFYSKALNSDDLVPIKTHDAPGDDQKAIYVVRDAAAAIVSYKHYLDNYSRYKADIYDVISGAVSYGGWSRHYRSWSPQTRKNTLFLKFEELTCNGDSATEKIREFLGLSGDGDAPPEFSTLQQDFPEFFRSGSNERNRAELTRAQAAYLQFVHGETLKELGYIEKYSVNKQSLRDAIDRQAEKLKNFRLGELADVTRSMYDVKHITSHIREVQASDRELIRRIDFNARLIAKKIEERDKYFKEMDARLNARNRKIAEQASALERQAETMEQLRKENQRRQSALDQQKEDLAASNAAKREAENLAHGLRKQRDALRTRNEQLEFALAPRWRSLLEFRAVRHVLAERRRLKAASAGGAAPKKD